MKRKNKNLIFPNLVSILFSLFMCSETLAKNNLQSHEEADFVSSFINNYGFTINSRDTHEYHSFILGRTRESFSALEEYLVCEKFDLKGRMVICGYQEDAIPSYYTNINRSLISDEASIKRNAGWQFASGNLFGFVTGFVLKDVNDLGYSSKVQQIFKHNQPERVGLFDDRAEIFHRHAFGKAYPLLLQTRNQVLKAIAQKKPHKVIALMRALWKDIYAHGISDGAKTMLATQDILFSIHYAHYLLQSKLPLLNFFVGPDITYPIEILRCQNREATRSAQQFVTQFVSQLKPIGEQNTAYVFCSFVDGVGKSTLLGNIKNYANHQDRFDNYERVDNSSSQRATVWQLKQGVIIADLPAQASHFIIKPDGMVYVSIDTIKNIDDGQKAALIAYVKKNDSRLQLAFTQLMGKIEKENMHLKQSATDEPATAYAKNCLILGKKAQWIPFVFDGSHYLYSAGNVTDIRILQPIEGVHSFGLKVAEPEQMIFSKGLALPLSTAAFLQDLSEQLSHHKVQNIVFVDFMSMYPRTSRENIRVNFIMQQLKYIFGNSFEQDKSLYKGFIQPQELYLLLKKNRTQVVRSLVQETGLRFALFELLQRNTHTNITQIGIDTLSAILKKEFDCVYDKNKEYLTSMSKKKIMLEYDDLLKQFAFDKEFESITRFDFEPIILLSKYITQLCSQEIKDDYLNALWAEMEEIFPLDPKAMPADEAKPKFIFADGSPAELLYTFDPGCRNTLELKEFLGVLRAHWYAAIANLFKTQTMSDEPYPLQEPAYRMPPIAVILDHNGLIRVVTKKFPLISHEQEMPALKTEHTFFIQSEMDKKSTLRWGTFFGEPICLDLKKIQSGAKLFAFSYGDEQEKKRNAISYLVDQFNYFNDPDKQKKIFMPTSVLIKSIEDQNYWPAIKNEVTLHSKNKNCAVRAAHRGIRMLATVDMLCKNLDSGVMVRKNNTPDFAAALELLEKITLPYYFGLSFPAKLFDSYESVEPIIPWESIESQ